MARTRSIKPGFFLNDLLGECHPLARLLFAGLWCHADRNGVVEYRPRRLKAEILPFDEADIDTLSGELEARGFIQRFDADGATWVRVLKFTEHQTPHPREPAIILTEAQGKPEIFTAGTGQAQALLGERQDRPRQAGFPTPSSSSSSLLPSSSSVASPACAGSPQQVVWAPQTGWDGITPDDRREWRSAFPAVDLEAELAAAGLWLKANPHKAKRTNWRKFLVGWLRNAQDRGGTRKLSGPGHGNGPAPVKGWDEATLKRLEMTRKREMRQLEEESKR